MRLVTNPTPVIQGPSNGGGISFKSVLGQGAAGAQGPQGLPGVNAVANDTATATYVTTPGSATANALGAGYVGTVASASVADGTTNDRAAIATADTSAASFGGTLLLKKGTHRVSSNLTVNSPVQLQPGAKIKPDSGVTVTLAGGVRADQGGQIFDHSAGGTVVPKKTPDWHPAWWGSVLTSDDSTTWTRMLASATASGDRPTIKAPKGTNRLWNITLSNVHLDCQGHTALMRPALAAVTGGGYMIKLHDLATIDGGDWSPDTAAGFDIIYYTGIRAWIENAYIKPTGVNTNGVRVDNGGSGSITPRLLNVFMYGDDSTGSIGFKGGSPDAELTNVMVAHCGIGIQDAADGNYVTCHVWECGTGAKTADNTRWVGCHFENNLGWGLDGNGADRVQVSASKFWHNGKTTGSTGGMRLVGSGVSCRDNRIDGIFDDNVGDGLLIDDADHTTANVTVVSSSIAGGGGALGTYGVRVTSTSTGTDLKVRGTDPQVLTALVSDAAPDTRIDLGRRVKTTTGSTNLGPSSTAFSTLLSQSVGANQKWLVRGWMIVDGTQAADMKIRVQATGATGASGWFTMSSALAASTTSTSASSVNSSSAATVAASSGAGVTSGLIGAGLLQRVGFEAVVITSSTAGSIDLQAGPANSDATAVVVSFAQMEIERVL